MIWPQRCISVAIQASRGGTSKWFQAWKKDGTHERSGKGQGESSYWAADVSRIGHSCHQPLGAAPAFSPRRWLGGSPSSRLSVSLAGRVWTSLAQFAEYIGFGLVAGDASQAGLRLCPLQTRACLLPRLSFLPGEQLKVQHRPLSSELFHAAHIKTPSGKRGPRQEGCPQKYVLVVTPCAHKPTREAVSKRTKPSPLAGKGQNQNNEKSSCFIILNPVYFLAEGRSPARIKAARAARGR